LKKNEKENDKARISVEHKNPFIVHGTKESAMVRFDQSINDVFLFIFYPLT